MRKRIANIFPAVGLFTLLQLFTDPTPKERNFHFIAGMLMMCVGAAASDKSAKDDRHRTYCRNCQ